MSNMFDGKSVRTIVKVLIAVLICLLFSCAKEYSCESCEPDPPVEEPVVDPSIYINFTAQGDSIALADGIEDISAGMGSRAHGPAFCIDNFFFFTLGNKLEKPFAGLLIGKFNVGFNYDSATLFFAPQQYTYSIIDPDPVICCPCRYLTAGVALEYRDSNGKFWATYLGSGDQQNSYFRITAVEGTAPELFFKADFTCKVYSQTGEQLTLSNGRLRLKGWP